MNGQEHGTAQGADRTTIGVARDDVVVPVIEEFVAVDKQVVDTGRGVRLHKRVHETLVPVEATLKATDYVVERVTVDRPIDVLPEVRYEGDTMIVPVVEERVVTRVQLVLVEEVRLTRRETSSPMRQEVLVRREEVVVERFDDAAAAGPATTRDDV